MTVRTYVAGQLIRLARTLDPNCVVDWTWIREQEGQFTTSSSVPVTTGAEFRTHLGPARYNDGTGMCYWCFEKATRNTAGVPLCDKHFGHF